MKQNVSPRVAFSVILSVLGIAGFLLWYSNRERPRPDHYGLPPGLQQMEDARASSFMKKSASVPKTPKADKKTDAKDSKPAEGN